MQMLFLEAPIVLSAKSTILPLAPKSKKPAEWFVDVKCYRVKGYGQDGTLSTGPEF